MASVYFSLQSQQKSLLQINVYKLIRLLAVLYKYSSYFKQKEINT